MNRIFIGKKIKIVSLIFIFLFSFFFPLARDIRPAAASASIIYADVDGDGNLEQARNNDGNLVNGYETFVDPDGSSAVIKSGNFNWDGHTDFFLDTDNDGQPDKYWDPSDSIVSPVTVTKIESGAKAVLDDWVFSSQGNGINDRYYSPNFRVIRKMPHATDLSISKTVSDSAPVPGETITYTYLVTNTGTSTAPGVVAANAKIPDQFTYQTSSSSQGVYNETTGAWAIGNLSANAHAKLTITAQVPADTCVSITDPVTTVSFTPTSTPIALPKNQNIGDTADASYFDSVAGGMLGCFGLHPLGDINGDGFDDFGLATLANGSGGSSEYVVFGQPTGWQKNEPINNAANATNFFDNTAYSFTGTDGVNTIDINGDGINDLVFDGGSQMDISDPNDFLTWAVFGRKTNWPASVDLASSSDIFAGTFVNTSFVNKVGDVNGDGLGDISAGDPGNDPFIIYGNSAGWTAGIEPAASSTFSFRAAPHGGLSALGDINGDGIDDFMLANALSGLNAVDEIFFGKTTPGPYSTSSASFTEEASGDYLGGYGTLPLGDVNGDGIDDIGLNSYFHNQVNYAAGKDYIIFGKKTGWQNNESIETVSGASFLGDGYDSKLSMIRNIGDVNGDGIDDLGLIGSHNQEVYAKNGKAYVVFGKKTGWTKDVSAASSSDSSYYGDANNKYLNDIYAVGDANTDGYADFLVDDLDTNTTRGDVYLFFGEKAGWLKDVNIDNAADAYWHGDQAGDNLQNCGIDREKNFGDLNGDGYDDFVVAKGIPPSGSITGGIYIIFGKESTSWLIDSDYANNSATADARVKCFSLNYSAGLHGSLTGSTTQVVGGGAAGSAVAAVPYSGYQFSQWSDDSAANPRLDSAVKADINVSALFTEIVGSGSGVSSPPPIVGSGAATQTVSLNQSGNIGTITAAGTNYLTYVNSAANFDIIASGGGTQSHQLIMNSLDLLTDTIQFTIQSVPQKLTLKLGQTINLDLDGDQINDLAITFAGLFNNRVELTIKSILNIPPAQAQTNPTASPAAVPAISTPAAEKSAAKYIFSRNLSLGSVGADVQQLQRFLNARGFILAKSGPGSPGKETAKFGALTRSALAKFQKANRIKPAVGYFGPLTRKAVNGK
ncbi:MAG TPA: peptidoglycan-binding protein [Candidatus Nanoarchaeia archaeon]|nr:peptidoglycan-binding protein [Candidatus Nanoarchaeia archaeon]